MVTIDQLDTYYETLSKNTQKFLPDGILNINIKSLHGLHLFSEDPPSSSIPASNLLHAVESDGRITLFNECFAVWIVPQAGGKHDNGRLCCHT